MDVLVVEDERKLGELLRRGLGEEGYALHRAAGGYVVLCFFASWCEKCAHEREYEKDLKKRFETLPA